MSTENGLQGINNIKETQNSKRNQSIDIMDFTINNSRISALVSITILYAMSQLFCGIVLPLSDSFASISDYEADHTYYLEVYLIIQYILAVISIIYLQGYIYIYEKISSIKKHKITDIIECKNEKELNTNVENTFNSSMENETKESADLMTNDVQVIINSNEEKRFSVENTIDCLVTKLNRISVSDTNTDNTSIVENMFIFHDNDGINVYLRLGAVGFGFGVMVHDGFKIADQVRSRTSNCHNHLWTPKQCLHLAYIFSQTFFIFKYHRIIYLKHKLIIRFILYHLTISNICEWFKTVVYEINHELIEHNIKYIDKSGSEISNKTLCEDQLSHSVAPYLFPCAIEYSLISAAVFFKMFQKVGVICYKKNYKSFSSLNSENHTVKYSECHRSHKGLFIGLLFFMATLVGLATFLMFKRNNKTQFLAIMVYQVSEIVLLVSSIFALISAFIQMRKLGFRQLTEEETFDDNLILISLAGVFTYNLFLFISTIDSSVRIKNRKNSLTLTLFLCKSLTEILQSLIQVFFLLESSRKCAINHHQVLSKPGRSLVTFLIIINLALWIISIFEAKRADEHLIFTKYYQKTPWTIITHTLLPLIIFFRFHSSICLTAIWRKSY